MSALATFNGDFALAKKELRRHMRAKREDRSQAARAFASEKICGRLADLQLPAQTVAVYLATPFEANIDSFARALQEAGVLTVAPRLGEGELRFFPIANGSTRGILGTKNARRHVLPARTSSGNRR